MVWELEGTGRWCIIDCTLRSLQHRSPWTFLPMFQLGFNDLEPDRPCSFCSCELAERTSSPKGSEAYPLEKDNERLNNGHFQSIDLTLLFASVSTFSYHLGSDTISAMYLSYVHLRATIQARQLRTKPLAPEALRLPARCFGVFPRGSHQRTVPNYCHSVTSLKQEDVKKRSSNLFKSFQIDKVNLWVQGLLCTCGATFRSQGQLRLYTELWWPNRLAAQQRPGLLLR